MPFPPGPAKAPWRALVARFLGRMYGATTVAPEAAFVGGTPAAPRRLSDVEAFVHGGGAERFPGGGRAFLARLLLEAQAAGAPLADGPVARVREVRGGRATRFTFGGGRRHDDLACGQALAAELMGAFWDEATAAGAPPGEPEAVDALFGRVAGRLKVRSALAPDRAALHDLSRRVVRLRVEAVVRGPGGTIAALQPAQATDYPRLWVLPVGQAVEAEDRGASEAVARAARAAGLGVAAPRGDAPVLLGWDLLTCNLVLLVEAPPVDRPPARGVRALKEVAAGQEDEFLRRSPACPALAAALAGAPS